MPIGYLAVPVAPPETPATNKAEQCPPADLGPLLFGCLAGSSLQGLLQGLSCKISDSFSGVTFVICIVSCLLAGKLGAVCIVIEYQNGKMSLLARYTESC